MIKRLSHRAALLIGVSTLSASQPHFTWRIVKTWRQNFIFIPLEYRGANKMRTTSSGWIQILCMIGEEEIPWIRWNRKFSKLMPECLQLTFPHGYRENTGDLSLLRLAAEMKIKTKSTGDIFYFSESPNKSPSGRNLFCLMASPSSVGFTDIFGISIIFSCFQPTKSVIQ